MEGDRTSYQGVTLLYVEDEEITRETVCTLLGRRFPGLTVRWAADGDQGWRLYQELRPDLVLTDIRMPVLSGIEMSRRILSADKSVPIVVTTAHSDVEYLIECIEIGISRYLVKPVETAKLFRAIDECLARLTMERELKAQQENVRKLNEILAARARELEIANRDLEAFSYTVSHDLRSPLTKISGFCQLIQELYGEKLDEQGRSFIDVIDCEALAMNRLINTLLEFSRMSRSQLERQPTPLSELAAEIAAELRMREPQRRMRFEIAPGLVTDGDPDLLRVVLDNLLGNACKYTGKKEEAVIEFGVDEVGAESAYFVRDNGAGFDMAQADKLFTAFHRLHSEEEFAGLGIGLATVHRIVQRHGGRVWATGEPDQGATFYFTLPAADHERAKDITQGVHL